MIVLLIVAVVSGVGLFVALLPQGFLIAFVGASLGGSLLTVLCAVGIAARRARRERPASDSTTPLPSQPATRTVLGQAKSH